MSVTPEQIALVNRYLPSEAKLSGPDDYGWTDDFIRQIMNEMSLSPAQAVRYFWYQRVQETAEYIDAGKGLTAIHQQARAMLQYWDEVLKINPDGMEPVDPNDNSAQKHRLSFGEIERPWE